MPSSRSLWPVGMESINQDLKMVFIWTINLFYCTVFTGITTALNQLSSFNKGASLQIWAYSIWTEDTAAVTPLIRGSPLSRETPQGSYGHCLNRWTQNSLPSNLLTKLRSYMLQCNVLETLDREPSGLWSCKKPEEEGALIHRWIKCQNWNHR